MELLGRVLISRLAGDLTMGIIVETEAYLACGDAACHAARGRTRRNEVMFADGGCVYVYSIHARCCFNVVTEEKDRPSAVLIRALEPVYGLEVMRGRRGHGRDLDLARGPARLCEAMAIDRQQNGQLLSRSSGLWIGENPLTQYARSKIRRTARIGVTAAKGLRLRFAVSGCRFVSGPRSLG